MKTSSKSLFLLIQTLTKEERSYILRTAIHYRKGGRNILIRLFKGLEQLTPENYDEKEQKLNIPNLSVRKIELYETILRSLADRETKNQAVVMLGKLRWAGMLHYRNLFPQALLILNEVAEWAKSENQLYIHGVILQYKSLFANYHLNKKNTVDFSSIGLNMVSNAKKILQISAIYQQHVEIATIIHNSYLLRTATDFTKSKSMFQSFDLQQDISTLPLSSQCFFQLSSYYLHKLHASYESAYKAAYQCMHLMHESPVVNFPKRRPQEYLLGMTAFLNACLHAGKLEIFKKWIPVYKTFWIEKQDGNENIGANYYSLCLAQDYLSGRHKAGNALANEAQQFLTNHKSILESNGEGRILRYWLMLTFFSTKDFSKAWDYCQQILNSNSAAPRRELYDVTRLLFLLILFETGEFEELHQYCQQLHGFIRKKEKKEYLLESTLVRHFKKFGGNTPLFKYQQEVMRNLNKDLKAHLTEDNLCVKQLLHYFDFEKWVKSKMKKAVINA